MLAGMSAVPEAPAPTPAPLCPEHPERASQTLCERCGRFLCEECVASREPTTCPSCHVLVSDPLGVRAGSFSIGGALSNGWKLFCNALPGLVAVALIFGVLGGLYSWAALSDEDSIGRTYRMQRLFESSVGLFSLGAKLAILVGVAEGRPLGLFEALKEGVRAWPRLFGATFRSGLAIFILCLLLIVPGVIKALSFAVVEEAAYREPGKDALDNSTDLTTGSRWELFGLLAASNGLYYTVTLPASLVVGSLSELFPASALPLEIAIDALTRLLAGFLSAVGLAAFYGLKNLRGQELAPR